MPKISKDEKLLNELLDWVSNNINPEDVYGHDVLIAWAKDHGMVPVDQMESKNDDAESKKNAH